MIELLKKIGTGKKHSKDLTKEEAFEAEKFILEGKTTDIQTGAFWAFQRIKYPSLEELEGFIDANKVFLEKINTEIKSLDLAVNYDGKNKSLHILPASIFIAVSTGIFLSGQGEEDVPSKHGITYQSVLKHMGLKLSDSIPVFKKTLENIGFGFLYQRVFASKLYNLLPKRRQFGLRTYHNTIEKILNPLDTDKVIVGFTHTPYKEKYEHLSRYIGFKRITIVKGVEGGIEPFPDRENQIFVNGKTIPLEKKIYEKVPPSVSLEENAKICLDILKNGENPYTDYAVLTAGILIVAYGKTESIEEAVYIAEEGLKSGKAYERFKAYRDILEEGI